MSVQINIFEYIAILYANWIKWFAFILIAKVYFIVKIRNKSPLLYCDDVAWVRYNSSPSSNSPKFLWLFDQSSQKRKGRDRLMGSICLIFIQCPADIWNKHPQPRGYCLPHLNRNDIECMYPNAEIGSKINYA
jgi:hypothetical protein